MSAETEHGVALPTPNVVAPPTSELHRIGQMSQFTGLYSRELLRTFRNPWVLVITVVQPFMWLAFFGSSFANAPLGRREIPVSALSGHRHLRRPYAGLVVGFNCR